DRSDRWRALSAAVMQELLLGRLWQVEDDDQHVEVHHDSAEALRSAGRAADPTAGLCPPPSADVGRDGAAPRQPGARKSTSFAPKPRTGLVLRSFALG